MKVNLYTRPWTRTVTKCAINSYPSELYTVMIDHTAHGDFGLYTCVRRRTDCLDVVVIVDRLNVDIEVLMVVFANE